MNPKKRQLCILIGGLFAAGFVHSILPPGEMWTRAGLTAAAALAMSALLVWLLPDAPGE